MKNTPCNILSTTTIHSQADRFAGWPSIMSAGGDELVVVFSGDRCFHIDPYGKTLMTRSLDKGKTWSTATVINDTPLDDRDAGIIKTSQGTWLLNFFTSRMFADWQEKAREHYGDAAVDKWQPYIDRLTPEICAEFLGSFVRRSEDCGKTWGPLIPTPVNCPHGPILARDGRLLYLGNGRIDDRDMIACCSSSDDGLSWDILGTACPIDIYPHVRFYEPHLVELPSGKLLGLLRANAAKEEDRHLYQIESLDNGKTWTTPKKTCIWGLPPHLLLHSSNALINVYGYRRPPYSERAAISYDDGDNWSQEIILTKVDNNKEPCRSVGPDDRPSHQIYYQVPDLGYPASVELDDGSIYTVYYQSHKYGEGSAIHGIRWRLP